MEAFLKEIVKGNKFELIIDTNIFSKDIILKAAYQFLDKGYFFFKQDENGNIVLQFTTRDDNKQEPKNIIANFSDELLATYLRDILEKENKEIREKIVGTAIANSLDKKNFVSINRAVQNKISFDKDIDEILKEIENDPEVNVDKEEIEKIFREIEEKTENEIIDDQSNITIAPEAVRKAKEKFSGK